MNKYCKKQLCSQISSGATLCLLCNLLLVLMNTSCEISRNLKGCYYYFETHNTTSVCVCASMWMPKVAGGTDFIHKVFQSLNVASVKTQITIDAHGYDGFAALACIEEGLLNFSSVHRIKNFMD